MKKYLWTLLFVSLFWGCGNNDDPQPTPENETMTILSYLVANNNLDDCLLANIGAMYDGLTAMRASMPTVTR